jgi:cytochrome c
MKVLPALLVAAFALPAALSYSSFAQASAQLAASYKCTACHDATKKMVGPTFKDIAAKYKTQAGADAMLAASISKGGKGKWGKIPMPAQPKVTPADAQALAKWVLTH